MNVAELEALVRRAYQRLGEARVRYLYLEHELKADASAIRGARSRVQEAQDHVIRCEQQLEEAYRQERPRRTPVQKQTPGPDFY